jgi:hypothetical protein
MRKNRKPYTIFQKANSIFLMLTLLWLTVSTPFVIASQQELAKQQKASSIELPVNDSDDEPDSGSNNNIEEKVPPGSNLSEEFLHEHHTIHHFFSEISLYHKLENSDTYTAFHGELLVPPPNAA